MSGSLGQKNGVQDRFDASHPVKDIFLDFEYAASGRFQESAFFRCHEVLGIT
jgi:hypothetical protein